jgi:hypothetical protein
MRDAKFHYGIEAEIRVSTPEVRMTVHQARTKPLLKGMPSVA